MSENFKVWISKYALTQGIFETEAKNSSIEGMINDVNIKMVSYQSGDWHLTKAEAIIKANDMRLRKISNLKKQIIKLENTDFNKQECGVKC